MNNEETMLVVTSNLAEAYGVDEDSIAIYTRAFGTAEGRQARLQRDAMHAAIINIAAAHAACDAVNCETGTEIHEALTLAMAVLRLDMDGDLRELAGVEQSAVLRLDGDGDLRKLAGAEQSVALRLDGDGDPRQLAGGEQGAVLRFDGDADLRELAGGEQGAVMRLDGDGGDLQELVDGEHGDSGRGDAGRDGAGPYEMGV